MYFLSEGYSSTPLLFQGSSENGQDHVVCKGIDGEYFFKEGYLFCLAVQKQANSKDNLLFSSFFFGGGGAEDGLPNSETN